MPQTHMLNESKTETKKPDDPQPTLIKDARPRRVLIVDDHKNVTVTLKKSLEKLPGYEVVTALRGEQALYLFEQQSFDLLLTDYCLPGIDGLTLAAQIRQQCSRIAIILITVYDDDDLHEHAARLSIYSVLGKPVKLTEIRRVAVEALEEVDRLYAESG